MPAFDEAHFHVGGVGTAVLAAGEGEPIVFFHGGGVLEGFDCFLRLAERFRLLVPYHPGFGPSADDPSVTSIDDWVRHYVDLFEALGIEAPTLVGHSLGGWLAARFTSEHPERVGRLVVASASGLYLPDHPLANPFAVSFEEMLRMLTNDPSVFDGLVPEPLDDAFVEARNREARSVGQVVSRPFDPTLEERLRGLTTPALVVWGAEDRIVPVAHAYAWQAALPNAELRIFPGRGHLVFHEAPEAVEAVLAFAAGS
jgi:pimeloyl-ACP methyl ester carboxylesterase